MRKNNKKGFTLVELLATIVILGILSFLAVTAVSRYIRGAHEEVNEQNKKTVQMAAEMYMQANRELLPKQVGYTATLPIKVLRETNYLKEDILNDKGETCMENSYVQVSKLGKNDYSYNIVLLCGNETAENVSTEKPAVINFLFAGGDGDGTFNDIKSASFSFTMKGGESKDIVIYGYQYSIFADIGSGAHEVYSSGFTKDEKNKVIEIQSKELSNYFSITRPTEVFVKIKVVNVEGGIYEYTSESINGRPSSTPEDHTSPSCGNVSGQAQSDSDWINKSSDTKTRRITVGCTDNEGGMGCVRDTYSQTWPVDKLSPSGNVNYKYGARWGRVQISDNADPANTTNCYTRVNVDLQAPEIVVTIYKAASINGISLGDKVLTTTGKKVTVKDSDTINSTMPSGTINSDQYIDLVGDWMNKEKYPFGIIINVEAKDNLYLDTYSWKVNAPNSNDMTVTTTEQDNGVAASGTLTNNLPNSVSNDSELASAELGTNLAYINSLRLHRDGKRHGELKVCDKAGNCTTLHIYANIDRTPPTCNLNASGKDDGVPYNGDWVNKAIRIERECQDPASGCNEESKTTLYYDYLGIDDVNYTATKAGPSGDNVPVTIGDKAGNSATCGTMKVQIDKKAPDCELYSKNASGRIYSGSWIKEAVVVSRSCKDFGSGCNDASAAALSYTYDVEEGGSFSTDQAGANGVNVPVIISDKVGNTTECGTVSVNIDKEPPTCRVTAKYLSGSTELEDYDGNWTNRSVRITRYCDDGNGSGCDSNSSTVRYKDYSSGVTETDQANTGLVGQEIKVWDNAKNYAVCEFKTIKVDKKAPKGTCTVTGWYHDESDNNYTINVTVTSNEGEPTDPVTTYAINSNYFTPTYMNTLTCGLTDNTLDSSIAKIKLTDSVGNVSSAITCSGSFPILSCCDENHIKYKDGTSCSANCGGGSYNRLAYSDFKEGYTYRCKKFDTSTGGSNCNTDPCPSSASTTVYACQRNTSHGGSNWYSNLSWTNIHSNPNALDDSTLNGKWVGYKSTLQITNEYTVPGSTYTRALIADNSCGQVTGGDNQQHSSFVAGSGTCSGWLYKSCYHTSIPTNDANCDDECVG